MIKLKYGNTNTYFLNGLLVDTDMPDTLPAFYREIKRNGIALCDIKYLLATHYHPDHIGLAGRLTELGVKLIIVDKQVAYVHFADPVFERTPHLDYHPIKEEQAIIIGCGQSRDFLRGIGIDGCIITTESHSPDGIALITDEGNCFAGDLEPPAFIEGYEDNSPLRRDWERIKALNPQNAYFGHINEQRINK